MEQIKKHMEMLGYKGEDRITGFKGVIDSIAFDLYGCIQVIIRPGLNEKGEPMDGRWFDINRVKTTSKKRVMEIPDFGRNELQEKIAIKKGKKNPADKPAR